MIRTLTEDGLNKIKHSGPIKGTVIRTMCKQSNIPLEMIDKSPDVFKHAWREISMCQKLNTCFLTDHINDVHWEVVSEYQKLDDSTLELFYRYLDKTVISKHQTLSSHFIEAHFNDLNRKLIIECQSILPDSVFWCLTDDELKGASSKLSQLFDYHITIERHDSKHLSLVVTPDISCGEITNFEAVLNQLNKTCRVELTSNINEKIIETVMNVDDEKNKFKSNNVDNVECGNDKSTFPVLK